MLISSIYTCILYTFLNFSSLTCYHFGACNFHLFWSLYVAFISLNLIDSQLRCFHPWCMSFQLVHGTWALCLIITEVCTDSEVWRFQRYCCLLSVFDCFDCFFAECWYWQEWYSWPSQGKRLGPSPPSTTRPLNPASVWSKCHR